MPFLRFKGVDQSVLLKISMPLIDDLVEIVGAPRDYFSIEMVSAVFIKDGKLVVPSPLVEIAWFGRPQEMQDAVAKCVTKHLKKEGYALVDVCFTKLKRDRYYENGEHF